MEHALQEKEPCGHTFRRQAKCGEEEVIIPDILVAGYGRARVNQSRCLKCKRLTFTEEPFCYECISDSIEKYGSIDGYFRMFKYAPKKNITTDQSIISRYIGFKQKTGISKRRSSKNFKWVIRRDEFTCQYCGLDMGKNPAVDKISVDHINPFCTGGSNNVDNLMCACQTCNCIGRDLMFQDYLAKREYIRRRRNQKGLRLWD